MTKKFYKATSIITLRGYDKEGQLHTIRFENNGFGSEYLTNNPKEQEVIESSPFFKQKQIRIDFIEEEKKEKEPTPGLEQIKGIDNYTDAKEYMVSNYGIEPNKLKNPAAIKYAAKNNGIEFSDWM